MNNKQTSSFLPLLLLPLLFFLINAEQWPACQGEAQTISISRGQKIAVVYWLGEELSADGDESQSAVTSTDSPAEATESSTAEVNVQPDAVVTATLELEHENETESRNQTVIQEKSDGNFSFDGSSNVTNASDGTLLGKKDDVLPTTAAPAKDDVTTQSLNEEEETTSESIEQLVVSTEPAVSFKNNKEAEVEATIQSRQSFEESSLPTSTISEQEIESTTGADLKSRFRSFVEQALTEVDYWSSTQAINEPESTSQSPSDDVQVHDSTLLARNVNNASEEVESTEEVLHQRSNEQPTTSDVFSNPTEAAVDLEGKNSDDEPEAETSTVQLLNHKSLLESLSSTLRNIFADSEDSSTSQDDLLSTSTSDERIIFEDVSKDPEIVVDPRWPNEDNETPPPITILQLGDKQPKLEEEEITESSISSSSVDFDELASSTLLSILDNRAEEARKIDATSNIEFIPLDLEGQQQQQQQVLYNEQEVDASSSSINDFFVPANFYQPNPVRIPQSRVHYVSMLRPPDGILPIQSLNLGSGYKSKRRRVLQRGGRVKRDTNSTHCEWIFKSEPGVPLLLTFKSFSTPETEICKDHYISVERESTGFVSRWCGVSGERPGHAAFARSEIRLQLHSTGDRTLPTGFSVEVQALDLKLLRKYAEVRRIIKGH